MNKKKTALWAGILGTGILAASACFYQQVREDRKREHLLADVRAFFADLGEVAVVYIYEEYASAHELSGGVVMEDGRHYLFEHTRGELVYEEDADVTS